MKAGTIKHYSSKSGTGTITPKSGPDVDFRGDVVRGADPDTLMPGEPIEFDVMKGQDVPVAKVVRVLRGVFPPPRRRQTRARPTKSESTDVEQSGSKPSKVPTGARTKNRE